MSRTGKEASHPKDQHAKTVESDTVYSTQPLSPTMRSTSHNPTSSTGGPSYSNTPGLRSLNMPKYHPAVYRSPNPSHANTPTSSRPSSRGLLSPRTHARQLSDVQKQYQEYQRQMVATIRQSANVAGSIPPTDTPQAPHLTPRDSPGPATPLNLEESADYLTAGRLGEGSPREVTERLIREERERRSSMGVDRSSPAISPRC